MDRNHRIVWAFDLGKGSIGEAVREGNKFLHKASLLIPAEFAETKTARDRRRMFRTREAHKAREAWLDEVTRAADIEPLHGRRVAWNETEKKWDVTLGDPRLEREFAATGDATCYTSCLLRIKLLRGDKLEPWQIYKALHSAIQRRGYDPAIPWKTREQRRSEKPEDDEGKTLTRMQEFEKHLAGMAPGKPDYQWPCYFDAWKMGLWNPAQPDELKLRQDCHAQSTRDQIVPRKLVEKEVRALVEAAAKLHPKLKGKADFLLYGPPGTGKTLLAKAVAGEAGVPFFSISGSEFVEMFVGVGASRVRDLFEQAKKNAPCIVFIDEIDAVGRQRGAGLGGGNDEREQTLNQLLTEMDGFEGNTGIIIVAATNRPDVLDPALLRPGRFDRRVVVPRPDVRGRLGILRVHTRKVPLAGDVDLEQVAKGTPGFSGADLENLTNEAALMAAREDRDTVSQDNFESAKDKVLMGSERRSMVLSDEEKKNTAYHEAGHALVARMLPGTDPVHKVTIIPRGMALGLTMQLPMDDKHSYNKDYLQAQLAILMGGRIAEEIFMHQITTGAGNDIERATDMARKMVCEWGMSELGPLSFGKREEQIFLGREIAQHRDYSETTAIRIDEQVKKLVSTGYDRARKIIEDHMDGMHRIAQALLEREVLDGAEVKALIAGEPLAAFNPPTPKPPTDGSQPVIKPEASPRIPA